MSKKMLTFADYPSEWEDIKLMIDMLTNTAQISGCKDGLQYTATFTGYANGNVQKKTVFIKNPDKAALISQIKQLKKDGYKQKTIADMLGISQSSVSKYLKK